MIFYFNQSGERCTLTDFEEYYIEHVYGGNDTLRIVLAKDSEDYKAFTEETRVEYDGNYFLVKKISDEEMECELDFDFLKEDFYKTYNSDTISLSDFLFEMLGSDWTIDGAAAVTRKRTISADYATKYELLEQAKDTFAVCYEWHMKDKKLVIIDPATIEPSGEYLTTELNLTELSFTGSTEDYITRLYPYGKDGLTIAAVNDGIEYVENFTYSEKVISGYWSDDRYTDAQSLKDAAIEKLKTLSYPVRSYDCDIADLAKTAEGYDFLTFKMYAVVTLLDPTKGVRANHQVMTYREYPEEPSRNTITLSSVTDTITTQISSISQTVEVEFPKVSNKVNEVRQEADQNSALLKQTYTKGETDTQIASLIQQATDLLRSELSEQYVTDDSLQAYVSTLEQTISGIDFRTSVRGGYNLLAGTAAFDLENWEFSGSVSTLRSTSDTAGTEAGGTFIIGTGEASTLTQTVNTVPGGMYCYMLRYKLTGSVTGPASITVQDTETALEAVDEWTLIQGSFTATGAKTTLTISNQDGYLYAADMVIIAGAEVNAWQQGQNEIITSGYRYTNGRLIIYGTEDDPLQTEITNSAVTVKDENTNEVKWHVSVGGVELDKTTVRERLEIQAKATTVKAFAILPQGDGHIYFIIND